MSLARFKLRVPLALQVSIVAALFVAALVVLWITGASVVARERRRSQAKDLLEIAGNELAARGREPIARAGEFPDHPEEPSREELDRQLSAAAAQALENHAGVEIEGGFLVLRFKSFMGTAPSRGAFTRDHVERGREQSETTAQRRGESRLPELEADLIDIQVDAAIRRRQVLFSVEELEGERPVSVAIRTAPLEVDGRVVGASWVMTRLLDPLFVDRSLQGYRLASGLALAGIALAFALTTGLAMTVRRQAVERDRLQADLRRSERLAALGKLLAGVAHEVRNPLAGIRSTAQLWQRGVLGLDEESLDGLVHEVDRLEEIVSRLLQFSRADAQQLAPGDLNAVLSEAARLAAGSAESNGVRVEVALDPNLPSVAMAPPALLQVFRNLTNNAIQAMTGGGALHLTTRSDPNHSSVTAIVADTGPGLPPDVIGHMFEPFYTTKPEGTGLGLAIAREIVLAHRGDLHAANRSEGTGAVFTLILPACLPGRNGEL
jgi:two-component system, NtrC family, sensor histidine kinase HydH